MPEIIAADAAQLLDQIGRPRLQRHHLISGLQIFVVLLRRELDLLTLASDLHPFPLVYQSEMPSPFFGSNQPSARSIRFAWLLASFHLSKSSMPPHARPEERQVDHVFDRSQPTALERLYRQPKPSTTPNSSAV